MAFDLIEKSTNVDQFVEKDTHFHRNIFNALEKRDVDAVQKAVKTHLTATSNNLKYEGEQEN